MDNKLKFEDELRHVFGYTGFVIGQVYTCSACGTKASSLRGGQTLLCPVKLHQKLRVIKNMVTASSTQNDDVDTMVALREMFGFYGQ